MEEQNGSNRPVVLIVDDDVSAIVAASRPLEDLAQVLFAKSGEAALALLSGRRVDVLLLDAEMPGMSGLDVLAALQREPHLAAVPVIVLTSHKGDDVEEAALAAGAVDFISKPIRPGVLHARVRTQLRLRAAQEKLLELSRTDPLTGLPNRRAFEEHLAAALSTASRSASPLALLMVDVDHFKQFNDLYGHSAGDQALVDVAACLDAVAGRPADIPVRWGGEEFALILTATDAIGAGVVATAFQRRLRERAIAHAGSPEGRITVSIGIACVHPSSGRTSRPPSVEAVVQQADAALYEAKRGGRNRMVVAC